jgi:hypothetical protein
MATGMFHEPVKDGQCFVSAADLPITTFARHPQNEGVLKTFKNILHSSNEL